MACREIGQWITDNIERPLQQWFANALQQCTEATSWFEERRTEIESFLTTQEQRCREQKCEWLCLCCNKWFCWLVDVITRIVTVLIEIIEHIVEAVCKLIVTLIFIVIMIFVQLVKWVILAVVCLLEALCPILILLGAVALAILLIAIVASAVPPLAPIALSLIPTAAGVAATTLLLARVICEAGRCRIPGAIGWAFKWAIVVGALLALVMLSPLSALLVAIYGGLLAALAIALERIPCTIPSMLQLP